MSSKFNIFLTDTEGATAVQYGLFAAMIGTTLIGSLGTTGGELSDELGVAAKVLAVGPDGELIGDVGDFDRSDAGTILLDAGSWVRSDALDGWDLSGTGFGNNGAYAEIKQPGYGGLTAYAADGTPVGSLDMGGSPGALTIARDLNTAPGQEYTVSFDAVDRSGKGQIEVWLGGRKLEADNGWDGASGNSYETQSFTFTAAHANERLEIREVGPEVTNVGTYLANIDIR